MITADHINQVFKQSIKNYHIHDNINHPLRIPEFDSEIEKLLYKKNWIDTIQWHLEDLIRDPKIEPDRLVELKRWIDKSNQERTDTVEQIDEFIFDSFKNVTLLTGAKLNSETPAWLIDRMSILQLKIYHFDQQLKRTETSSQQRQSVNQRLQILLIQEQDLTEAYTDLIVDLAAGRKKMKLYKQMKMYNDPNLNPVLYAAKK